MRRSQAPSMRQGGLVRRVAPLTRPAGAPVGGAVARPPAVATAARPAGVTAHPAGATSLGLPSRRPLGLSRGGFSASLGGRAGARAGPARGTSGRPSVAAAAGDNFSLGGGDGSDEAVVYFKVLYTKRSKKKHKSYLDGTFASPLINSLCLSSCCMLAVCFMSGPPHNCLLCIPIAFVRWWMCSDIFPSVALMLSPFSWLPLLHPRSLSVQASSC